MKEKKRNTIIKLIATVFMTAVMLFGALQAYEAHAGESDSSEKALIAETEKLLELGDEFETDYFDYDPEEGYSISWRASGPDARATSVEAGLDNKGHLVRAYFFDRRKSEKSCGTWEEMLKYAENIVNRLIPGSEGCLKVVDEHYEEETADFYYYCFRRVENGHEALLNLVDICVGKSDGKLVSVDIEWDYDIDFPASEVTVTAEEAWDKVLAGTSLGLYYGLGRSLESGRNREWIYLAYMPEYGMLDVDAVNGSITVFDTGARGDDELDLPDYYSEDGPVFGTVIKESKVAKTVRKYGLKTLDEVVKGLLKNKYLLTDPDFTQRYALLTKGDNNDYYWDIMMVNGKYYDDEVDGSDIYSEKSRYYAAIVDARTGELRYFRASEQEEAADKLKYSKKKCRKILEKFLKKEYAGYSQVKLTGTEKIVYYGAQDLKLTGSYRFSYTRFHEGISLNTDGVIGGVDRVTGKINYYYWNYSDHPFPEPSGVIPENDAIRAMYQISGIDPVYVFDVAEDSDDRDDDEKTKVKLVYRFETEDGIVDAFTGKVLRYDGTVEEEP